MFPDILNGSLLVTITDSSAADKRSSETINAASITCSKLSRIKSLFLSLKALFKESNISCPGISTILSVFAIHETTRSG
jgi:hypothetical protein